MEVMGLGNDFFRKVLICVAELGLMNNHLLSTSVSYLKKNYLMSTTIPFSWKIEGFHV